MICLEIVERTYDHESFDESICWRDICELRRRGSERTSDLRSYIVRLLSSLEHDMSIEIGGQWSARVLIIPVHQSHCREGKRTGRTKGVEGTD